MKEDKLSIKEWDHYRRLINLGLSKERAHELSTSKRTMKEKWDTFIEAIKNFK